jgi:hypothetical protein
VCGTSDWQVTWVSSQHVPNMYLTRLVCNLSIRCPALSPRSQHVPDTSGLHALNAVAGTAAMHCCL